MHRISIKRLLPRVVVFSVLGLSPVAAGQVTATVDPGVPVPIGRSNDECRTPDFISGQGYFDFDTTTATTGHEGQHYFCGFDSAAGIHNDEWFCWTSDCDGIAIISTCGLTDVDTRIALWRGCECPPEGAEPLCCNDDDQGCGRQSTIECEVRCGEQYLIQIGNSPGQPPGNGRFVIRCEGRGCGYCPPPSCCGTKPLYADPAYSTFTGQVLVMSGFVLDPPVSSEFAVTIFDIKDHATAPLNMNWNPPNFRYSDPRWTKTILGSVFGLTIDDRGHIYAARTSVYVIDQVGTLPGSGWGTIYKLENVTGTPTVFVNLPNAGPGLGNVAWDCQNSQLFASNMEDGRIYRIAADGTLLSAYDHATNTITNGVGGVIPNEPNEPDGQFAPLGERVWAVKRAGDRLYYSVWVRDQRNIFDPAGGTPNQVWSVQLNASGNFVAGTRKLEISMPAYPGYNYSMPVSDISFSPDSPARMLCAERHMVWDSDSGAHSARVLEFACDNGVWRLTSANTNVNSPPLSGFPIGQFGADTNSAGGCDYDWLPDGRVWCSGDALHLGNPDDIYGGCGMLRSGAASANNILFDYNGVVNNGGADKTQMGDVAIPCEAPCSFVSEVHPHCEGNFHTVTFTVTNFSASTVHYLLIPDQYTAPHVIPMTPPLPPGGSGTVTVTVTGLPEDVLFYCFDVILADIYVEECCRAEVCFDVPVCECVVITSSEVTCDPVSGLASLEFTFLNLRPDDMEHVFLVPLPPHAGAILTPDYVDIPATPPMTTRTVGPVTIDGVDPGDTLCIRLAVHNNILLECCSVVVCFEVPFPCAGFGCPPDFNNDGTLNSNDLFEFLGAFFAGDASADYDHDGAVDTEDFFRYTREFFLSCD